MASQLIIHLFRVALPALISVALFIAPTACAQQCGVALADNCATELSLETGQGEEPAKGEYEHQAHHCPNCNVQWSGSDGGVFAKTTATEKLNPPLFTGRRPIAAGQSVPSPESLKLLVIVSATRR
jgi:hypothetical protein